MPSETLNCVLLFLILPAGFLLWTLISPRSVWQTTAAWSFRNPEANEPSDAGYAAQRVGAAFGLAVLLCLAVYLPQASKDKEQSDQRERYEQCLADERADDDGGLLSPEDWCENVSPSPDQP